MFIKQATLSRRLFLCVIATFMIVTGACYLLNGAILISHTVVFTLAESD